VHAGVGQLLFVDEGEKCTVLFMVLPFVSHCARIQVSYHAKVYSDTGEKQPEVVPAKANSEDCNFGEKYKLGDLIATGSSGKCYVCRLKAGGSSLYCCKVITKMPLLSPAKRAEADKLLRNEVAALRKLQHPNIVQLYDIDQTSSKSRIYIVMEMMHGGELFDHIIDKGALSEKDAANICHQVASAVAFCHRENVVHRDLKPENLLLAREGDLSTCKVRCASAVLYEANHCLLGCGFRLRQNSAQYGHHQIRAWDSWLCCSRDPAQPGLLCEEHVSRNPADVCCRVPQPYDKAVDVWSMGVIIYVLLHGFMPFEVIEGEGANAQIEAYKMDYEADEWQSVSTSAKELLWRMLQLDPKQRMTAEEVLAHPWVKGSTASDRDLSHNIQGIKRSVREGRRRRSLRGAPEEHGQGVHDQSQVNSLIVLFMILPRAAVAIFLF
jgi:serine/threonine protein kinase